MSNTIRRPRLLEQMAALLGEGHLFINAPAGYGKTLLLQSLQTERPYTYFIPLSPADSDPAALRERLEPLRQAENTLLLDDVHHLLEADATITWLKQQMRQAQPRWVLAGRQPLFPATDLALYGKINQLGLAEMAFDDRETRAWLGDRRPDRATWQQQLEGWPLGLALLKNLGDAADPQPIAEKQLFEYLTEQMFAALPPDLQRFMTVTAVPLTFTPTLAATLLPDSDPDAAVQSLLTRNLFLYHDIQTGSYRYHDLIRAFLRQQLTSTEFTTFLLMVINWLCENKQFSAAIEHALNGGLPEKAAALLAAPEAFVEIRVNGRFLTHHRWISALPPEIVAERPLLLLRNGAALFHLRARRREAWEFLHRGVALAEAGSRTADYRLGLRYMAFFHGDEGHNQQALTLYQRLIAMPDLDAVQKIAALQDMISLHAFLAQFDQAQRCYLEVQTLTAGTQPHRGLIEQVNFASLVLAARGQRASAHAMLTTALHEVAAQNNFQDLLLIRRNLGHLLLDQGDWAGQRENLTALEAIVAQAELVDERIQWSLQHDRGLLAVGDGRFAAAAALFTAGRESPEVQESPLLRTLFGAAMVWLHRRQGQYQSAIQLADKLLAVRTEFPYYEGRLALERDIAALLSALADGDLEGFQLTPQTRALIPMRARAELVRLRMMLAIICWRQSNPRWRRLARRVLVEGERPLYGQLLTTRDPELAAAFWKILLVEGLEPARTDAALRQIGQSSSLLPLLRYQDGFVRGRAATLLAQIGQEEAMPALATAVAAETNKEIKKGLHTALTRLESLPPPPLHLCLMGDFRAQRGEDALRAEDFHRPIVARLLQYFALHAGQPIPRDQILEDLWPDGDPEKTAVSFRTINSHLRSALDPFMRPRGPNRYIVVERDVYRFDPYSVVGSDVAQFTRQVDQALAAGDLDDDGLDALSDALAGYAPLLPDLPYADWLLEPRQQLEDLYLEGCLCAAEAYLSRRQWVQSQTWLRRGLQVAPWLEKAWQMLMRAYARQGHRTLALKAYQEAVAALERELGVGPSELTLWLVGKVQNDEPI
ncbi:MAG: winged helix-turn-helix domain-containing protein [Chloroflexi bacterium]|nr:winged helix-turn-helix domain-containing protein [Chloroflexota bacterium]